MSDRTGSTTTPAPRRARRAVLAALAATPLLLAACGSASTGSPATSGSVAASSSPSGAGTGTAAAAAVQAVYPVVVKADNGQVTVPARPSTIVSLSPTATEMLFAVGAGAQVKAVDDQSSVPAEAPRTKLSGFQPNAEAIAGYRPDLVVLSNDVNGIVAALGKLKVPVLLFGAPATVADGSVQELALGAATGHAAQAQQAVDTTRRRIAAAVARTPKAAKPLKIYHEVDNTYYSVTSSTFIGDLYRQFGLVNIADSAPKAAGGYPKLSAEFVITAAPDLIVLADGTCCQQNAATVAKRPAFAGVPAVTSGRVVVVQDDVASRWGPSLAQFAEKVADTLAGKA